MNYDNMLRHPAPSVPVPEAEAPVTATTDSISDAKAEPTVPSAQSLGAIFDQAVDIYKANFIPLLLIVALVLLPAQILLQAYVARYLHPALLQINAQGEEADVGFALWIYLGYTCTGDPRSGIPGLITLLLPLILSAPIAVAIGEIYFGRTPSVLNAYRVTLRKLLPITAGITLAALGSLVVVVLWAVIISIIDLTLAGAIASVFASLHWESQGSLMIGILFLVSMLTPYFVVFLFIARYFSFLIPIIVLEDSPVMNATLRTSLLVGKLRFWRTWFALICLPLFTFGIQGVLIYACDSAFALFHLAPEWQFLSQTAVSAAASCFLQPYWMILLTLLYFDYRVQRECFDLRILAAQEAKQ